MVELKARSELQDVHLAQSRNYVVVYDLDIGLLINFGAASLEYKRIYRGRGWQRNQSQGLHGPLA